MAKVKNISSIEPMLPFTEFDFLKIYRDRFDDTILGKIKKVLPLKELAEELGLFGEKDGLAGCRKLGRKSYFSPEGKVALVFLKHLTGMSAPRLMEELNGNLNMQIFCGISISPDAPLKNYRLLDAIYREIAGRMDILRLQPILAEHWKPFMNDLDTMFIDATCYESWMRYPTDTKLLWESIEKSYEIMCENSSKTGEQRLRTKYREVSKANLDYRKKRRHSKKQTRKLTRRLLNLLGKILGEIKRQVSAYGTELMPKADRQKLETIETVYRQQKEHFEKDDAHESIPDRIVSLSKPHVRPIIRGKENKSVEFGAKCNNIVVSGLSFIEHISYSSFHEGHRLASCIELHRKLFGEDVKKLGGDLGYASNENRTICAKQGIVTSFAPKGKNAKDQEEANEKRNIRKELARVRATTMEGSFGTQKNHYGANKANARLKETEILAIFFGIHTANAVLLAKRIASKSSTKDAA